MFSRLTNLVCLSLGFFSLVLLCSCTNKTSRNHKTTLKMDQPVEISINVVSKTDEILRLRPQIKSDKKLTDVKVEWVLSIESEPPQNLFTQEFTGEIIYQPEKLEAVDVYTVDPSINHKVALLVSGKADGQSFSLSKVYNSAFQEDLDEAKEKLLERSQSQ